MAIDKFAVASIIYRYAKAPVETFADDLYEKQKELAASVCRSEEERNAVIDAASVEYILTQDGTEFSLNEKQSDEPLMVKLVDEGKPTPETKGKGGTRIGIDGLEEPAESYSKGYLLTDYGWSATHFKKDTNEILRTTSPDIISGVAPEANNEIANEIIKPAILEQIH